MTAERIGPFGDSIGAALDYVEAAFTGLPEFTETVAAAYGHGRITRGLGALVVLLITEAAIKADSDPAAIIQTLRQTYGGE